MAVPLDEPLAVVAVFDGQERDAQGLDGVETFDPEELFFEGADEPLGAAVALRLTDERRARRDAQEAQLGLEVVAQELAAVVVAERQPARHLGSVGREVLADALAEWLERLEAGA